MPSDPPNNSRRPHGPDDSAVPDDALGDTLRWAFELEHANPAADASWVVREIVPGASSPFDAVLAPTTDLATLTELKNAFKELRTGSPNAAERSFAARLYAATIAAALVRYGESISTQREDALRDAFAELEADASMPARIRELASLARDARADRTRGPGESTKP